MIHWTRFVGLFLGSRQKKFDILQYEHGSKLNTCLSFYPGVFTTRHNTAQAISPYYSDQIRAVSDRCYHYCKTHFPFPYNSPPGLEKSLRPNQVLDLLDTRVWDVSPQFTIPTFSILRYHTNWLRACVSVRTAHKWLRKQMYLLTPSNPKNQISAPFPPPLETCK